MGELAEVELKLDEYEAIRLADLTGLYQEEAAKKMGISRQTFGNILQVARQKVADAIVNSKAIRIKSGCCHGRGSCRKLNKGEPYENLHSNQDE